eukprot:Nk52_evm45s279 gene=Nk52_evmTU45s279
MSKHLQADMLKFEQLKEEVAKSQATFEEWTKSQKAFMESSFVRQNGAIEEAKENYKQASNRLEKMEQLFQQNSKINQEQGKEIKAVECEIEDLKSQEANLYEQKCSIEDEIVASKAMIAEQRNAIKGMNGLIQLPRMQQDVEKYSALLGLDFLSEENRLKFVFKNIDPDDWNKPFSFTLFLDDNNCFQISSCVPQVEGLSDLLDTLNSKTKQSSEASHLSQFVKAMRKKFKKHVFS